MGGFWGVCFFTFFLLGELFFQKIDFLILEIFRILNKGFSNIPKNIGRGPNFLKTVLNGPEEQYKKSQSATKKIS